MVPNELPIPTADLDGVCREWKIVELSLFGAVLREDFGPGSDVDVLVSFEPGAPWTAFDLVTLAGELGAVIGRRVDVLERRAVERHANPWLRHSVLSNAHRVYAA